MNKGQRAMVAAMADPEGHQGKSLSIPGGKVGKYEENMLSRARIVYRHARELADKVRLGSMPLAEAYCRFASAAHTVRNSGQISASGMIQLAKSSRPRRLGADCGRYQESDEAMKPLGDWSASIPLIRSINAINLGKIDEATSQTKNALELDASLNAEEWRTSTFVDNDVLDRQVSDLIKAGLPEKVTVNPIA